MIAECHVSPRRAQRVQADWLDGGDSGQRQLGCSRLITPFPFGHRSHNACAALEIWTPRQTPGLGGYLLWRTAPARACAFLNSSKKSALPLLRPISAMSAPPRFATKALPPQHAAARRWASCLLVNGNASKGSWGGGLRAVEGACLASVFSGSGQFSDDPAS